MLSQGNRCGTQKDVVKKTIASNIKKARINSGMTQAEAAEKLGITAQAISNFERGLNGIENSLLLQMCEIYHTSICKIFSEEKESTMARERKEFLTDESVEEEIARLRQSPYVKLAQKEERIRNRRRQFMYVLRMYERKGRQLSADGYTMESLDAMLEDEMVSIDE